MTHPHKYGHLRLIGRHEIATISPDSRQDTKPPAAPERSRPERLRGVLKTVMYASVLVALVGLQPLITLAAFELAHSYGPVAGLTMWSVGSVSSTYVLLGHLRR